MVVPVRCSVGRQSLAAHHHSIGLGAEVTGDAGQAAEILSTSAWRFSRNHGRSVPCTHNFATASPG